MAIVSYVAQRLDERRTESWRAFNADVPAAHFAQDPAWAKIECSGRSGQSRSPYFFWCERDGVVCLTALGVRRRLPVPRRVFWEFDRGPTLLDPGVLHEWLPWLVETLRGKAARVRLQPAMGLDALGDEVETILDTHGFVRRRAAGGWATLVIDIDRPEDEILASFRARYRSRIRQSSGLGIDVSEEDGAAGWNTLAALDAEMSARTGTRPTDASWIESVCRNWCRDGAGGTILVARLHGEPLAAILVVAFRSTAHMLMMPSSRRHGNLPTSHRLLWDAMCWAKAHGFSEFDLDGYSLSARPGDALWGINQFKRGFAPGDEPRRSVAIHERIFSPAIVNAAGTIRRLQARRRSRVETTAES